MAAGDGDSKFDILNRLPTQLASGFHEAQILLNAIVRRRQLVDTFDSYEKRRALHERLATILPDDPYVLQHRSILERDLDNPTLSVEFARGALRLKPNNPALQNTLGL